jgi:hypothetical protein
MLNYRFLMGHNGSIGPINIANKVWATYFEGIYSNLAHRVHSLWSPWWPMRA